MTKKKLVEILENHKDDEKILIHSGNYINEDGENVGIYSDLKYLVDAQIEDDYAEFYIDLDE